ncbi:cyclic nucleotide-binding domain-containing protein [Falsihalocynthiibacter sp. S25ZX9]|uniref:cyclic nucleotide-binding domain-containing protein n=1 Tax=Falsihalocynthiibacter sp. S25ZX9 TaxID=3240870 RepID=UPI003510C0CC
MSFQTVELIGFAASALVFLTFCMQTLLALRLIAAASNILFIIYAVVAGLTPILVLHGLLFPINIWRLQQQLMLRRRIANTFSHPPEINILMPFMTFEKFEAGSQIFSKGDLADRLYVIIDGEVRVEGVEQTIKTGEIFGEIGLFSGEGLRTGTVSAVGQVETSWINRTTVMKVFEDHPDFALALTMLITSRLIENQTTLHNQLKSNDNITVPSVS